MKYIQGLGFFAAAVGLAGCSKTGGEPPQVDAKSVAAVAEEVQQEAPEVVAPTPTPEVVVDTPDTEPEAAQPVPSFAVAEWGVLVYEDTGAGELTSGPPVTVEEAPPVKPVKPVVRPGSPGNKGGGSLPVFRPTAAKKPVVYLRPDAEWDLSTDISVTVTMTGGGTLHEVWPTPDNGAQPAHGATFAWTVTGITRGACAPGWGPSTSAPACNSLSRPDACEAAEFEGWVPDGEVCLDAGGVATPALLYNGFPEDRAAPLARADGEARGFANVSKYPVGLVLLRDAAKPDAVTLVRGLAVGASAVLTAGEAEAEAVDVVAAVAAEIARLGLSEKEAADFMRAWTPLLKDPKGWTAFGFFEPGAIEAVSRLEFTPKPSAVHRVMAFAISPSRP